MRLWYVNFSNNNKKRIYKKLTLLIEKPLWETVKEEDIQTSLEVYRSLQQEGFHVDYLRIPITDEQGPIPRVFDLLVERLMNLKNNTDAVFNCQQGYDYIRNTLVRLF